MGELFAEDAVRRRDILMFGKTTLVALWEQTTSEIQWQQETIQEAAAASQVQGDRYWDQASAVETERSSGIWMSQRGQDFAAP